MEKENKPLSEKTFVCDQSFMFGNEKKHVADVEDVKEAIEESIKEITQLSVITKGNTTIKLKVIEILNKRFGFGEEVRG